MISFLGTGLLGSGLAEAAARRGERVAVWNRTLEKARALEAHGARVAESAADAVRGAERVHLVLKDDDAVESVIQAMRPGLSGDAVIVDHTTTQPARTAERASRLTGEGVHYLHCPVFIGPAAARQGEGTILASGPRELFDRVQPSLARMAERVEYLGERADLAAVIKLCGNVFIVGITGVAADMYAVAAGAGVSAEDAFRVTELFNPGGTITGRGRRIGRRDYAPSFELDMARKDVRLMIETAADRPLAILPGMAARMDALIAEGHGRDDLTVLGRDSVDGSGIVG